MSKLKNKKFDAIGLYMVPAQLTQFFKQAKEQDYKIPSFGTTTFQSKTVIKETAGAMDGSVFVHNYVTDEFRDKYESHYGDDIQIPWAANAYDFAMLTGELFGKLSKRISAAEVLEKVASITHRKGVGGEYKYVHSTALGKYFEYPVSVYKIEQNNYSVVK
ncbi:MAG: ABC transporter substrate-binding protein [Bdellovibrionota bacterium]